MSRLGMTAAWSVAVLMLASNAAAAQQRDWPTEAPPRPLPSRQVNFPPYEIRTLPNGMQVVAVLHHEQPAVSIRLLVRASPYPFFFLPYAVHILFHNSGPFYSDTIIWFVIAAIGVATAQHAPASSFAPPEKTLRLRPANRFRRVHSS